MSASLPSLLTPRRPAWGLAPALLWLLALAGGLLRPLGAQAQTYTVSTLAGGGTTGTMSGSTDGTGTAALFYLPIGVAVDGSGTRYVADKYNHKIRKITAGGVVTTLAGGGTSGTANGTTDGTGTAALFDSPSGVAVAADGTVYVADYINSKIRKITAGGVVTTLAGGGTTGKAFGNVDGPGTTALFSYPSGVAVAADGTVYVADASNYKIRKITALGVVTTLAGGAGGNMDGTGTAAQFNNPTSVAVDGSGTVYVADQYNHKIRKITAGGVVTTLAGGGASRTIGSTDGTGTAALFNYPFGVAVDGSGTVYVADQYNNKIRKITAGGVVTTLTGGGTTGTASGSVDGPGTAALFNSPTGVAVDGSGTVYVADQSNNKIRLASLPAAPTVTTAAASALTATSATLGGNVTTDGGTAITERGVVYVAGPGTPTTSNTRLTASGTTGSYSVSATGLTAGTQYTARAYATNALGTSYGSSISFTTTAAAPAPTAAFSTTAPNPGLAPNIPVTLTFSQAVTGLTLNKLSVTNGAVNNLSGSGTTYTFTLLAGAAGTTTVQLPAGAVQNSDGTGNVASPVFTYTYTNIETWTGAVSTDWNTAGNWSLNTVPTLDIDALVAPATRQPVVSGTASLARNVTVQAGATLTLAAAAVLNAGSGNATGNGSLLLASGSTLVQQAGSEIYLAQDWTNNGATLTLAPTSEVSFGGPTHSINGTAGTTFQTMTVGERFSGDYVLLRAPVRITRTLAISQNGTVAVQGGSLTLLSDASGTALVVQDVNSFVIGSVTVQRYIDGSLNSGLGYRHFSAPVTNTKVADLAVTGGFTPVLTQGYNTSATPGTTTPFPNVFAYDQTRLTSTTNNLPNFDKGWVVPQSTDALTPGRGYAVNIDAGQLVDFQGTLGNGNLGLSLGNLNRPSGSAATTDGNWYLVGNPYPAPLDLSLIAATDRPNLDAAVYVVQSTGQYTGGYRAFVNGQSTTGTNNPLVPTAQGFFVRVSNGQTSGILRFRNSQRVTDYATAQGTTFQRPLADTRPALRLTLAGHGLADGWVAYAQAGATASFDTDYDAAKLPNGHGLNLSSAGNADNLAIDGRPAFSAATVLPLAVGVPAAGSYTIAASALDNLPAGLTAYLRDAATGTTTPLTVGTSYSFTVTSAQAQALLLGRFTVQFSSGTALATAPAALAAQVQLYPNPAREQATLTVPGIAGASAVRVELLNSLGQVVLRQSASLPATGAQLTLPTAGLAAGVYSVRLQAGQVLLTKRLTIQ